MSKLAERLRDATRSGVYRVTDDHALAQAASETKLKVTPISLSGGKADWLQAFARALDFPDWYGANWDALEDCLSDLPAPAGNVLVLRDLPERRSDDLGVLLDILDSTAGYWKSLDKPFFAVLVDGARRLDVPALYRGA